MPRRLTSQFWIGNSDSADRFYIFIGENAEFWSEEIEYGDVPLNSFIATQGQISFDTDFFEAGFSDETGTVLEKFGGHSYVENWASLIEAEMVNHGMMTVNSFIMVGVDEARGTQARRLIHNPSSCREEGIDLTYIGEVSYDDYR